MRFASLCDALLDLLAGRHKQHQSLRAFDCPEPTPSICLVLLVLQDMGKVKLPKLMQTMPDLTESLDLLMLPCGPSPAGLIESTPEIREGQGCSSTIESPAPVASQPESVPKYDEGRACSSTCETPASAASQPESFPNHDEGQACQSTCKPAQSAAIETKPMPQEKVESQACMSQSGTSTFAAIQTAACEAASRGDTGCLSQMIQNGCAYSWMLAAYHAAAQAGQVEVLRLLAEALPSLRISLTEVSSIL